jgi:ATP:ADP antiporter, AAA family
VTDFLCRITGLEEDQLKPAALAAVYIFCILAGYYVLKPLREEIGLLVGKEHVTKLFVGTMLVMLVANPIFSYLMNRFSRVLFIKIVYRFFGLNIVAFIGVFKYLEATGQMPEGGEAIQVTGLAFAIGVIFFLWVSVYNLFCGSLFWALMADLYDSRQSKKIFGLVGAGGTIGGIVGSWLTKVLVTTVGPTNLLFVTMVLLEVAVIAMVAITKNYQEPVRKEGDKKPNAFSGVGDIVKSPYLLGICFYLFLYTFTSSFIYFQQQYIVDAAFSDRESRVDYYATIGLVVNSLTLVIQLFFTGRLLPLIGVSAGLSLVPIVTTVGFMALGYESSITVLAGVDICRRTCNYAITRPSREILFTVVSRQEKYLSKSFIDTFVYRAGDAIASGAFESITAFTANLQHVSLIALPIAVIYLGVAWFLGKAQVKKAFQTEGND